MTDYYVRIQRPSPDEGWVTKIISAMTGTGYYWTAYRGHQWPYGERIGSGFASSEDDAKKKSLRVIHQHASGERPDEAYVWIPEVEA